MVNDEEFFLHLKNQFGVLDSELDDIKSIWGGLQEVTRAMYKTYYRTPYNDYVRDLQAIDESVKNCLFKEKLENIVNDK